MIIHDKKLLYLYPNYLLILILSPENIATIPLRIEPFDSQYVSFRLPFFNNTNPSFKLVLVTPRKNYSVKVKLLEYHELIQSSRHKHQEE